MEIINSKKTEVEMSKRCYIPVTIKDKCPICSTEVIKDYSEGEYLMNPITNRPFTHTFCCTECDHEWDAPKKLVLRICLHEEHSQIRKKR